MRRKFCDALNRTSGFTAAVTDRDAVIAITGAGKRELLGKSLSEALSRVMEERRIYCCQGADQPPARHRRKRPLHRRRGRAFRQR